MELYLTSLQANSHAKIGWERFTDALIAAVDREANGVVFILWGGNAQKKCAKINKKKHHLLTSVHPSPLSAHRGFLGCGVKRWGREERGGRKGRVVHLVSTTSSSSYNCFCIPSLLTYLAFR